MGIDEPAASDGAEAHADWLELVALQADDRNSSFQDLVAVIRRSGSIDAVSEFMDDDSGSEKSQEIAEEAFTELDRRSHACAGGYPFEVGAQHIQVRSDVESASYTFMLLLSRFGLNVGPQGSHASTYFEKMATEAARRYLGGDATGAEALHFGFPRIDGRRDFRSALIDLCQRLGEGGGHTSGLTRMLPRQKDAKLDVVAWRHFADRRVGKLVAFGQCATGANYDQKVNELSPSGFSKSWMAEPLALDPLTFFFIPFCLDDEKWLTVIHNGVIAFDRCRISSLLHNPNQPQELAQFLAEWNSFVLKNVLGRQPS